MDKPDKTETRDQPGERPNPDITCSVCGARGKALVGVNEEMRKSRYKCRKCDGDYWENQATGMINQAPEDMD